MKEVRAGTDGGGGAGGGGWVGATLSAPAIN